MQNVKYQALSGAACLPFLSSCVGELFDIRLLKFVI